jgi:hypothetical protein
MARRSDLTKAGLRADRHVVLGLQPPDALVNRSYLASEVGVFIPAPDWAARWALRGGEDQPVFAGIEQAAGDHPEIDAEGGKPRLNPRRQGGSVGVQGRCRRC